MGKLKHFHSCDIIGGAIWNWVCGVNGKAVWNIVTGVQYIIRFIRLIQKITQKNSWAAWATGKVDLEQWNRSLQEHFSLIAVDDGRIVGFGDMNSAGYLDRLYVHMDYQRKGIATALCEVNKFYYGERQINSDFEMLEVKK